MILLKKQKKPNGQIANVPNPPVPNRAHTEMKAENSNGDKKGKPECDDDSCEIDFKRKGK